MEIIIEIPNISLAIKKSLAWLGFGYCFVCGKTMISGGWYDEKSFCPDGHEMCRENPPSHF
jgi:hypothetical protein